MKHDRTPWTKGAAGNHTIHGRVYKNLTEFSRPCAACGKPFSIFVTEKIADGQADSNSFGLKNCEEHRRNKTSAAVAQADTLAAANAVMKAELDGLYVLISELRGRLARYELQPAMEAVATQPKMPWETGS